MARKRGARGPRGEGAGGAKPADRRPLREALWQERAPAAGSSGGAALDGAPANCKRLIGFDWDCTLTVQHFFKVFAWGYAQGQDLSGPRCEAFVEWCKAHDKSFRGRGLGHQDDIMVEAVEDFCRQAGEDAFNAVVREVFLGGPERIALIASWLEEMRGAGVEFAIVTAGISATVLRALTAVPEWLPFFGSSHIWDVSQGRHSIASVAGMKALILRDLCPKATRILLVDDSLCRDAPPPWVLQGAAVETFELPYEGPGVTKDSLKAIEAAVLA